MAEKLIFRQRMVFAKNLGFGVGFGHRNNTTPQSPGNWLGPESRFICWCVRC